MIILYLIAILPFLFGAFLWIKSRQIIWWEWGISTVVGFLIVVLFNIIVINTMTADTEMWSGKIVQVVYEPEWIEEYQVAIYRTEYYTDSSGNRCSRQVFDHYETRHRQHGPNWTAYGNFGKHDETYNITQSKYDQLRKKFGGIEKSQLGSRPGFDGGDRNDYYLINNTNWIEPVNCTMSFVNRVKAAPSIYQFVKVPKDMKGLYEWPTTEDPFSSKRLLGLANQQISTLLFDQMCTRLGPTKKVNVIMIGWFSQNFDSMITKYQEAKWIGGRKNDLVLCYGCDNLTKKVTWSYVFGWTEREIVKRNLETILLNNQINNNILSLIEQEIIKNYEIKEWDKFNYLTVEPPGWSYWILIIIMIIIQGCIWYFFMNNDSEKNNDERGNRKYEIFN